MVEDSALAFYERYHSVKKNLQYDTQPIIIDISD